MTEAKQPTGSDWERYFSIAELTDEEQAVIEAVLKEVREHHCDYKQAGAWLDKEYSPQEIRRRWAEELCRHRINPQYERNGRASHRREGFPSPLPKTKSKDLQRYDRLKMAVEDMRRNPPNYDYLEETIRLAEARRVILLLWLLVDQDAHTRTFKLTDFQKWAFQPPSNGFWDNQSGRYYARIHFFESHKTHWVKLAKAALGQMGVVHVPTESNANSNTPSNASPTMIPGDLVGQAGNGDLMSSEQAKVDLAKLERDTAPFDKFNGKWVRNTEASRLEGIETATLASYRKATNGGVCNGQKTLGRDSDGRIWRRVGTPGAHPWYLRSTLKSTN